MNREDFPILSQEVHGKPLVYLDNAASSQKPTAVIEAMSDFYRQDYANVHRGIHTLSERATNAYEAAREKVARFINAPRTEEVIFTRNTTEAINLVATGWGRKFLEAGDAVLLTEMEHHSNIVPWFMLKQELGIEVRYIPVLENGLLDLTNLSELLDGVKLLSFMHASNVLGTINPARQLIEAAREVGATVHIDGAQTVPNMPIDVQALDADFYSFSSHKMCGPSGIGVVWGRTDIFDAMKPYMGGGDMIHRVTFDTVEYAEIPHKFEAGTPSIVEAVGLGAAVDYLTSLGMDNIERAERQVTDYALDALRAVDGLTILGEAPERTGAISFVLDGVHPHDIATIVDQDGVAIRSGHHCAQPLVQKLGHFSTARASLYFYNTPADVDALVVALAKAKDLLHVV